MRLWHEYLISNLPDKQLLAQHRECCALRVNGWGKKHSAVDYVFNYKKEYLVAYHFIVIQEMKNRKLNVSKEWEDVTYCGKNNEKDIKVNKDFVFYLISTIKPIFEEHDEFYLEECIENLKNNRIKIN